MSMPSGHVPTTPSRPQKLDVHALNRTQFAGHFPVGEQADTKAV